MAHKVRFGLTLSKWQPPTCVPDVEESHNMGLLSDRKLVG